jgi:hypothetical protein
VYACDAANVPTVISVDSHVEWIDNVRKSIRASTSDLSLSRCELGEIGEWGFPTNTKMIKNFWRYMVTPWEVAREKKAVPDTILIDGRFRVASFLYSLIAGRKDTLIMFDDYLDRPYYSVVENYCELIETQGRMGVFRVGHNYSHADITATISQYSINPK